LLGKTETHDAILAGSNLSGSPLIREKSFARQNVRILAAFDDEAKRGESAAAFNALAKGLACAAFQPGGVKFLGDRWEVVLTPFTATEEKP